MSEVSVGILLIVSYALPFYQGRILAGAGSDNSVHVFLINVIKENGYRLFIRVPRIINDSFCGAFPLMLHLLLARFRAIPIDIVALHLNPLANLMLCFTVWASSVLLLDHSGLGQIPLLALSLLVFTPQYFNAFNARNYGVSSRSLGILFFAMYQIFFYCAESGGYPLWASLLVCISGYLILAFNTFAAQALVLTAILYSVWTISLAPITYLGLSLIVFLVAHPRYGSSYLWHTLLFINKYRTTLADITILKRRFSIWRDLTGGIVEKFRKEGIQKGASYAYGNSLLVLVSQNPLTIIATTGGAFNTFDAPYAEFCWRISVISLLIFLATTFRKSRFLGEPERYVEMATPFVVVAAAIVLSDMWGHIGVAIAIAYQLLATSLQMLVTHRLGRHLGRHWRAARELLNLVDESMNFGDVRFGSNNDEMVKIALDRPWHFARHWSFEMRFAGLRLEEAFDTYPIMFPESFAKVVKAYRLNAVVIDKKYWDFSSPYSYESLRGFNVVSSDKDYVLLARPDEQSNSS